MPLPPLSLSLQFARFDGAAAHRAALPRHRVARWVRHALGDDVQAAEITVRIVDAPEGQQLNRDFRGKDYATNVLTFAYAEGEALPGVPDQAEDGPLAGHLVLCVPLVVREAAAQRTTLEAHSAHLVVHGMLHLQGFDHENGVEAAEMEALETSILRTLGYADPYA